MIQEQKETEGRLLSLISGKRLLADTAEISKEVRITSLPEEKRALAWLASQLEGLGYQVHTEEYPGYISYPVSGFVEVESPFVKGFQAIPACFTPSTGIYGISGYAAEYGREDLTGKIAVTDGLATDTGKIRAAQEQGALGMIFVHDKLIHNCPSSDIWGAPEEFKRDGLVQIPVVNVTRDCGYELRSAMNAGMVKIRLESTVVNEWREKCPILTADLPSEQSDLYVLFSGHIDSWDYGAMDNGSANAVMLECARLLAGEQKGLRRGLRLCFWSGHSQGRYAGSSWYVDQHFEELEARCCAHVNIDSVGGMGATVVEEAPVMPQTRRLAAEAVSMVTGTKFTGKRIARNSDQSLLGVGTSSVFGTFSEQDISTCGDYLSFRYGDNARAGGLGWWWHTTEDTIDKLSEEFLVRDCKIYLAVLWRLLTEAALPLEVTAQVDEMLQTVDHLAQINGERFCFAPLRERLNALREKTVRLDAGAEAMNAALIQDEDALKQAERLIRKQLRVSQELTRLTFHEANIYDFDDGGGIYPIPALKAGERLAVCCEKSSRYYMALTELRRGYNLVMGGLRRAMDACGE